MAETVSLEANQCMKVEWKIKDIFSDHFLIQRFHLKYGICCLCFRHRPPNCTKFWEDISIDIRMPKLDQKYPKFRIRCFMEDKEKKPQFPYEVTHDFGGKRWHEDIVWSTRMDEIRKRKERLVTNGVATFVLILTPVETLKSEPEIDHKSTETSLPVDVVSSLENFSVDLSRLLHDRAYTDVTLQCKGRTIAAHRAILSSRSEVFSAMLRSDMSESRDGVITIIDIEAPVLEHLVQYIYTGSIPDLSAITAQQLYEAADKYAIESLKTQCSNIMKENMTKKNACSILVTADAHCDSGLKEYAVSFIVSTQLLLDDIWVKFRTDHPLLAKEVHVQAEAVKDSLIQPGGSK